MRRKEKWNEMRFCGQFETFNFLSRNFFLNRLAYIHYIYNSDGFQRVWLSFNFLKNGWRGIKPERKKALAMNVYDTFSIFYPFFLCSLSISINILNLIMKYTNI